MDLTHFNKELNNKSPQEILTWCYQQYNPNKIKLSTSFGVEGCALIHMLVNLKIKPKVFTIDTGRNFQETYNLWQEIVTRFHVEIETYFPDPADITELTSYRGPNLFYANVENRKRCCYVRKVKPLLNALAGVDVWISGVRSEQSESRADLDPLTWDEKHQLIKISPLLDWTEVNVWEYVRNNDVPYNKLHDQGYPTIGCAPCSRPVRPVEEQRSGRWWWEMEEPKECGIHFENGQIKRKKDPISWSI